MQISDSSIFVEKYRPKTIKDLILPSKIKNYLEKIVEDGECPNFLLSGSAGRGKTSIAYAICNDLKADSLYINGSLETSLEVVRSKVLSFATTTSFLDSKKIVILDECCRLSPNAMDALKGIIESSDKNCRFIFTTNNIAKIIDPIKSRTQLIDFNFSADENKEIKLLFFKRCQFILENEGIKFDKKILAEFVSKVFPDFRKTLNELQKCYKFYGEINDEIFKSIDGNILNELVRNLKEKKFNTIRKIATEIEANRFFGEFYSQIDTLLQDTCKPDIILILGDWDFKTSLMANKEIGLVCCLIELMKASIWK